LNFGGSRTEVQEIFSIMASSRGNNCPAAGGDMTVTAVKGGLEIAAERGGDAIIIANAAVIVSLDDGTPD
jgi:hypothetical protein